MLKRYDGRILEAIRHSMYHLCDVRRHGALHVRSCDEQEMNPKEAATMAQDVRTGRTPAPISPVQLSERPLMGREER